MYGITVRLTPYTHAHETRHGHGLTLGARTIVGRSIVKRPANCGGGLRHGLRTAPAAYRAYMYGTALHGSGSNSIEHEQALTYRPVSPPPLPSRCHRSGGDVGQNAQLFSFEPIGSIDHYWQGRTTAPKSPLINSSLSAVLCLEHRVNPLRRVVEQPSLIRLSLDALQGRTEISGRVACGCAEELARCPNAGGAAHCPGRHSYRSTSPARTAFAILARGKPQVPWLQRLA